MGYGHSLTTTKYTLQTYHMSLETKDLPYTIESAHTLHSTNNFVRQIVLSGTSKNNATEIKEQLLEVIQRYHLSPYVLDTLNPKWNISIYNNIELPTRQTSLINLLLITDTTSYGAIKDIGMAIFWAAIQGTYVLIYAKEDIDKKSNYSRALQLAQIHYNSLTVEYPWLKHYIKFVNTPEEMGFLAERIFINRK